MLFGDRTYENILRECLQAAPPGIDLRQGSIFYDAVASAALKIAGFYADVTTLFDLVFITTSSGEYLDRRGQEFNVWRNPATKALYEYAHTGSRTPALGERFFQDGRFFTLRRNPDIWPEPYLEAETPGTVCNNIENGSKATPMINMPAPSTSTFGSLIEPGADTETDENYRRRIMEKISGPAENGNRQHYKTWAESIAGVGRARIIPLFAGPNTVMGVIIDTEGMPASQTVIDRVQEFIDPITNGLMVTFVPGGEVIEAPAVAAEGDTIIVGGGLGDGQANIGAHFAAVAPNVVRIDIAFDAELAQGANADAIIENVKITLDRYLRNMNLNTPERTSMVVRVSDISAILHNNDGLIDYANLTLNGKGGNILLTDRQIAALGEVRINAHI